MLTRPITVYKGADFTFIIEFGTFKFDDFSEITVEIKRNSDNDVLAELTTDTGGGITEDSEHNVVCKLSADDTENAANDTYDIVITAVFDESDETLIEKYAKFIEIKPC
jgi:hypothetical protein